MTKEKKTFKVQDHIGIFDNYFPESIFNQYINYFDQCVSLNRNILTHVQDKQYSLLEDTFYNNNISINRLETSFHKTFWAECYPQYVEKYPVIRDHDKHRILDLIIQKTEKEEGYHKWHNEMQSYTSRNRFMTFSLYLNDVKEGGETEFLNQSLRINAVKNRLVIFPASYTHVHRGNPPLSGTKYMLTGWLEFGE